MSGLDETGLLDSYQIHEQRDDRVIHVVRDAENLDHAKASSV